MNTKAVRLDGNSLVFMILIPVVFGIVWYGYSFNAAISMLIFLGAMYCYFNWFLNITLSLRAKTFEGFRVKLIFYTTFSIAIFVLSVTLYGFTFTLKNLLVTVALFIVQLVFKL